MSIYLSIVSLMLNGCIETKSGIVIFCAGNDYMTSDT
jgi:hypothetical protein